jgi:signal transduction histidine kinase
MESELLRHAMLTTALGGAALAAVLLRRARSAPGAAPLGAFLLLVGVWSLGLLYPGSWGEAGLALAPAAAAVFVHFAGRLTGTGSRLLHWSYGVGVGASLGALALGTGRYASWPGAGVLFRYEGVGLFAAGAALALAGLGHWLLLKAWRMARGIERTQLSTVLAASLLGLGSVAGLAFPLLGVEAFPWPLLLTPAYLALLAYGVLRHELLADRRRLREAAQLARLAELGALAATVAHDLRNPLNIIGLAVAECDPAVRGEVRVQTARMEALVRDLLDYAKPWRVEPTWLAGAEVPARLAVWADPPRLRQALVNLIANASAAGGRTMVIAEATGEGVLVHVCDDGAGVPEAIRATLFQPFVSRSGEGTGLGLAIVAKVMDAHGGTVTLSERPGWTTCFTLRFPEGISRKSLR